MVNVNRKTNLIVQNENYMKRVFKICHQNICGLQFKIDELVACLYPDIPDIVCISKHHLNSEQIQLISLEEYNLNAEFCRQSFHKRVCMYILKRFSFSVMNIIKYCKDKSSNGATMVHHFGVGGGVVEVVSEEDLSLKKDSGNRAEAGKKF
jgi:hypothetical protein